MRSMIKLAAIIIIYQEYRRPFIRLHQMVFLLLTPYFIIIIVFVVLIEQQPKQIVEPSKANFTDW